MCFYKSHKSKNKNRVNIYDIFPPKRTTRASTQTPESDFFALKLVSTERCSQTWTLWDGEMEPIWTALAQHLQASCVIFGGVDDNQTFLLLLFFRWISRKWLLVWYFRVHKESGLLWCLLDASWCNMKNKEKSSFFCCKYNLFSCGCAGPSLPSCGWTKLKSSRLLFRHSGRVPHSRFTAVTVEVKGKVWLGAVQELLDIPKLVLYKLRDDV